MNPRTTVGSSASFYSPSGPLPSLSFSLMNSFAWSVGCVDGIVERSNIVAEHSHNALEICRHPNSVGPLVQPGKLRLHLSSVFEGGRTFSSEEFQARVQSDHLLSGLGANARARHQSSENVLSVNTGGNADIAVRS